MQIHIIIQRFHLQLHSINRIWLLSNSNYNYKKNYEKAVSLNDMLFRMVSVSFHYTKYSMNGILDYEFIVFYAVLFVTEHSKVLLNLNVCLVGIWSYVRIIMHLVTHHLERFTVSNDTEAVG